MELNSTKDTHKSKSVNLLPVSVLLPIYKKDSPIFFHEALNSLLTLIGFPSQVIIGIDGPLTIELMYEIDLFSHSYPAEVTLVRHETNRGLGYMINSMAEVASNEVLARMDADDICRPDRFVKQYDFIREEKLDLIGGQISEFKVRVGDLTWKKKVPIHHDEIVKYLKMKSPFTHPTIMFTKEIFVRINGLKRIPPIEDYDFFVRCHLNGARFGNVKDTVLDFRLGPNFETLKRRRGFDYLRREFFMYYVLFFRKYRYYTVTDVLFASLFKLPLRLLPFPVFLFIYKKTRK